MTPEQIQQWAREACKYGVSGKLYRLAQDDIQSLQAFAHLVRNATLEEAAKLCDEQHDRAITSTGASRADACANRIRSLKT